MEWEGGWGKKGRRQGMGVGKEKEENQGEEEGGKAFRCLRMERGGE